MLDYVLNHREDETETEREIREEAVRALAAEWNRLTRRIEQQSAYLDDEYGGFDREEDQMRDRADDDSIEAENAAIESGATPEVAAAAREAAFVASMNDQRTALSAVHERPFIQRRLIEDQLGALGARMARPYEHWNEEEAMIEYLENRGY